APWEIWLSESQERMLFAVPSSKWTELKALFASEDVEAAEIGVFKATGRLTVHHKSNLVADLSMKFLHDGLPRVTRTATYSYKGSADVPTLRHVGTSAEPSPLERLKRELASLETCSKEWIIRQYDHEVQGQTI